MNSTPSERIRQMLSSIRILVIVEPSKLIIYNYLILLLLLKVCLCLHNFNLGVPEDFKQLFELSAPAISPSTKVHMKRVKFYFEHFSYIIGLLFWGAKGDWDFEISDLVINPDETDI